VNRLSCSHPPTFPREGDETMLHEIAEFVAAVGGV
jgi:hypothetical protein